MRPTIKDVAKMADVSIATVSLVLNNNQRISKETRRKVNKAIETLNYHPSRSARGLVSRKTGNLGFILTDNHFLRTEPFYTRVFLGTEFEAREKNYYVLLSTINTNFKKSDPLPRFILERNFDGIIIAGRVPDAFIKVLSNYNLPVVFVDYTPSYDEYANVLTDNVKGGILATEHLISRGHKNIAFIGGEINHPSIIERMHGYKTAIQKGKIKNTDDLIITNDEFLSRQNGYKCAELLFKKRRKTTAIFAANDATAIGALQYLKDNGYIVPEDVSLIGFDDVEADLLIDPPLSTIRVPKIEMGTEAVQLLINIINKKSIAAKKIIIPVKLIVRESTSYIN
jgi:LacI family transcriptional regulator